MEKNIYNNVLPFCIAPCTRVVLSIILPIALACDNRDITNGKRCDRPWRIYSAINNSLFFLKQFEIGLYMILCAMKMNRKNDVIKIIFAYDTLALL